MKQLTLLIFIVILYFSNAYSQETTSISKPFLTLRHDTLIISYNFLNYQPGQVFEVWLFVENFDGKEFKTKTLSGDVGPNVTGGTNKTIYWDLHSDSIFINDVLFVTIKAAEQQQSDISFKKKKPNYFLSSLVFPGSGLSKIHKGKPYWLMGVVGYTGLATTIHFNYQAKLKYDDYEKATDPAERESLYNSYKQNIETARIAAISTGVIWVTNLIWTAVASQKEKKRGLSPKIEKLQIETFLIPETNTPGLTLKYRF